MRANRIVEGTLALLVVLLTALGGAAQAQVQTGPLCPGKMVVRPGMTEATMQSGGQTRSYLIYVPPGYDPAEPTPLVISLHGFGSTAGEQASYSGWNKLAESQHFIAVYPNGTGRPQRWNSGQRELPGVRTQNRGLLAQYLGSFFETVQTDDVAFTRDLIAQLSAQFCIDGTRIFVNGISNGGGMTNRLACELADQIAAAGMVEGAYTDFPGGCHPVRPIPVVAFHGVTDPIVPYAGNALIHFPAIETWVADWAARDQCSPTPETIAGTVGAVTGTRYTGCAGNAEVDFYSIADGGHTWPGGPPVLPLILGNTNEDIDASATMWAFFQAHPMR